MSNAPSFAMKQTAPPSGHSISIINSLVDRPLARAPSESVTAAKFQSAEMLLLATVGYLIIFDVIYPMYNVACVFQVLPLVF